MSISLPVTLISSSLPYENIGTLCDVCAFRGSKWLVCACDNILSIYSAPLEVDLNNLNQEKYILQQTIEHRYSNGPITAVSWSKPMRIDGLERGEFVVASGDYLSFYAPLSLFSLSPEFESFKVCALLCLNA